MDREQFRQALYQVLCEDTNRFKKKVRRTPPKKANKVIIKPTEFGELEIGVGDSIEIITNAKRMIGDYVCVGKQTFDLEEINDLYGYEPEYGKKLLEALREEKPKFVPYVFNVFGGRVSMDKFDKEFVKKNPKFDKNDFTGIMLIDKDYTKDVSEYYTEVFEDFLNNEGVYRMTVVEVNERDPETDLKVVEQFVDYIDRKYRDDKKKWVREYIESVVDVEIDYVEDEYGDIVKL